MNSYRISRQQRIILELLYKRKQTSSRGYDYWVLIDLVRESMGMKRATRYFVSSFGRSIRNLLNKGWISTYAHSFGQGRGYYTRMFDIQIANTGMFVAKNRAVR